MSKPYKLSVKAVILDPEKRCLLIRRSAANRNFVGKWEWPGGKVDVGEDFASAVVRETREETGLEVEITGLAGVTSFEMAAGQIVVLCVEARALSDEIYLSEEHDDFAWVSLKEFSSWNLLDHNKSLMLEYAQKKGENHV